MEKIHTRALEALQPFVHLAATSASPTPRFIANLITNATSSPSTFFFAELLEVPTIQALGSPDTPAEYRAYLSLLEIFAWGTWQEYQATPNLPPLNAAQTQKLRLLSLLTLSTTHSPLTYSIVMTSLSLPSHAAVESLITDAIYSSIVTARLSPATNPPMIHVASTAPLRDVRPQTVSAMITMLTQWQGKCTAVIGSIEAEISKINADGEKQRVKEKDRIARVERSVAGWDGDHDDDATNTGGGAGGGTKQWLRSSKDGGSSGRRLNFGSGGRSNSSLGISNKREFTATNDSGEDYGNWGHGDSSGMDMGLDGSKMDIDEVLGGTGGAGGGTGKMTTAGPARHAKRLLGTGGRS